jgi:CRISPR type IV-associated protein Csf2
MAITIFKMTLKSEQPISITLPVAEGTRANRYENSPVMTRGLNSEGEKQQTSYIPATTFRGMLRRHVVVPKMEERAKNGKPYSLDEAYQDLIGQDKASEQQPDEIDLMAIRKLRQDNPVVDLFGVGLGVQSRLKVSHFLPSHNVLPEAFTTARKDLGDNDDGAVLDLVSADDRDQYLKRTNANSKRSQAEGLLDQLNRKKRKDGASTELDAQIEATQQKVDEYREAMDGMTNSSRTILTHYAMPAGLEWAGRMVVTTSTDNDIDVLCNALDRFSRYPMIGAQVARGCGEISGQTDIEVDGVLVKRISFGGFEAAKIDTLASV